jgi:hypothetical protein
MCGADGWEASPGPSSGASACHGAELPTTAVPALVRKPGAPEVAWRLCSVPALALVGGADPQDPVTNLSGLKQHFPDSRTVIFPHIGHQFGIGGCADPIMADFVDRGTTNGLDTTRCNGAVVVPPFDLPDSTRLETCRGIRVLAVRVFKNVTRDSVGIQACGAGARQGRRETVRREFRTGHS